MNRRGAMLIECIVAVAIFVAGGLLILGSLARASVSVERVRDTEHGAELAGSAMAQIECGLARPEALVGQVPLQGSGVESVLTPWWLEIETEPSAFDGLTHVTIRAVKRSGSGVESASFTLHQLVRLFGTQQDGAGDVDPLAERLKLGVPGGREGGVR